MAGECLSAAVNLVLQEPNFTKVISAVDTFSKIITNIMEKPSEAKFRRIRTSNNAFKERLWSVIGGPALLKAVKFMEVEEGQFIEMTQEDADIAFLSQALAFVQQEVNTKATIHIQAREFVTSGQPFFEVVHIPASTTGKQLKQLLHERMQHRLDIQLMKLVHKGTILKDAELVRHQVQPDHQGIVRMLITKWASVEDRDKSEEEEQQHSRLERIIRAAEAMTSASDDRKHLELQDQNGNLIHLPPEQHHALIVGMALHGKGNSFWRQGDPHLALKCLIEADQRFRQCPPEFLKVIDNYGTIHLDICWIYILLNDPAFAESAATHLKLSEEFLNNSHRPGYGKSATADGVYVDFGVLYLRLHIAQAVFAFLSGQTGQAVIKIEQAMREIHQLQVKDEDLAQLLSMGYSEKESFRALRACKQSIPEAVEFINDQRRANKKRKLQSAQDRADRNEAQQYGLTMGGHPIEMQKLRTLEEFGFATALSVEALRLTDNDQNRALDLLMQSPELLESAVFAKEDQQQERCPEAQHHGEGQDQGEDVAPSTDANAAGSADIDNMLLDTGDSAVQEPEPEVPTAVITKEELDLDAMEIEQQQRLAQSKIEEDIGAELLSESWLAEDGDFLDTDLSCEEAIILQYHALIDQGIAPPLKLRSAS